jgi:hypothetical protein
MYWNYLVGFKKPSCAFGRPVTTEEAADARLRRCLSAHDGLGLSLPRLDLGRRQISVVKCQSLRLCDWICTVIWRFCGITGLQERKVRLHSTSWEEKQSNNALKSHDPSSHSSSSNRPTLLPIQLSLLCRQHHPWLLSSILLSVRAWFECCTIRR